MAEQGVLGHEGLFATSDVEESSAAASMDIPTFLVRVAGTMEIDLRLACGGGKSEREGQGCGC